MTENTTNEPNALQNGVAFVRRNKTTILAVMAVTSVAANAVQGRTISMHNAFLKERGLFDEFYAVATNEAI